jgi:peptidoglycan-associated lipoprotein
MVAISQQEVPMNKTGLWAVVLASAVFAAGCSSTGGSKDGGAGGDGAGVSTDAYGSVGLTSDQLQQAENRTIYFDLDQSEVPPRYYDVLRAQALYLIDNPGMTLTIEGHCDERGSREYNIALGERRANAVTRFLEAEGVAAGRVNAISYGEERPADPGQGESAWALNRRAIILY